MPLIAFQHLPDDARVWVFGAASPLAPAGRDALLRDIDDYLAQWQAHGHPLTCAREWRDDRFLAIGVDQSTTGASGCSVDALYRILQAAERALGTSLMPGGRIFYRDANGAVEAVDRATFVSRAGAGAVHDRTPVFDTTLTDAGTYRRRFERSLGESWHARLVG